ncbi:MAG: glycosyltransferase family 9 protein [Chloroflexota bacterium]
MNRLNQNIMEKPLEDLLRDREALAIRNKTLADAYHQTPLRHRVRRYFLNFLANAYVPPSRRAGVTDRILLIRPDHVGDVLLTTPAIRALRELYPHTEIHALVGPWAGNVLSNFDEVDLVLTIPFPGFTREAPPGDIRSPYQFAVQTSRRLRRIGYAKAIVFRPDHWWGAWLARLTGIPERIGYDDTNTALFLTHTIPRHAAHAVAQNMALVGALSGKTVPTDHNNAPLMFPISDVDRAYVQGYLSEWDVAGSDRIICIHPGSGTAIKQWDIAKWAQTADILSEQLDATVVFTGSDAEYPLINEISSQMESPTITIAGDTDIGQLAALYSSAQVVIGPDSGPMHIALATGTPTVTLFGPADPAEFGPWGDPRKHAMLTTDIRCRPCRILDWSSDDPRYHPCVRDITVTQVLTAARLAASYKTR